jgi:hypothetical protein
LPEPDGLSDKPKAARQQSIFSKGRRDLDPKDFSSPVASQFMIDRIERLETENEELNEFRKLYHERDADVKVLPDRAALSAVTKNIATLFLSIASAGAGIIASIPTPSWQMQMLFVI